MFSLIVLHKQWDNRILTACRSYTKVNQSYVCVRRITNVEIASYIKMRNLRAMMIRLYSVANVRDEASGMMLPSFLHTCSDFNTYIHTYHSLPGQNTQHAYVCTI